MTAGNNKRTGARWKMFARMLRRGVVVRRGRALTALLAVVVAATVSTAMLTLFVDVEAKLRHEFRSYGANVVVVAKDGSSLPPDALAKADSILAGRGIAVPFAYAIAHQATGDEAPVVVAGTDMARVQRLNSWWSVTAWPSAPNTALVGVRAQKVLSPDEKPFGLAFEGRKLQLKAAGTVRSGSAEDSRVYLPLEQFTAWTHVAPSSLELAVSGSADEVNATIQRLSAALPQAEVKPVRQIVEAEAKVLGKTRMSLLASAAIIILTAALCVLATLTTWVLDRRKDFAIMKALGASERMVNSLFAAEAALLAVFGAVAGYAIGIGVAAWIGRANFHAAIVPRFSVFPVVLAGSVAVALLSAVLPISLLRRVQPAIILRGE
jgi:putative ABC transport system permease protein